MIAIREATHQDVAGIREVYQSRYGDAYAYPQYYDLDALARLAYADDSILLVAVDEESGRIAGTASVVFGVGAYNDLVGEFGRLVVHPDYQRQGIGGKLMSARLERVQSRLHVGIVENRAAHVFSQKISKHHGFAPVGLLPMKLLLGERESVAVYTKHFANALQLRRNHPRIIPEAQTLAEIALENCKLPTDAILDDTSAPYPYDEDFQVEALTTEGYASLLRIERGRVHQRDIFGPVRLHYGLFQLEARHSHYLIARRGPHIAGGIGFMIDEAERAIRVFELISASDAPIRFLFQELLKKCVDEFETEYVEVDVSAYSPRMQRTLLELGFLPGSYVPANVFHEVERLDAIRMAKLLAPFAPGELHLSEEMAPIAEAVLNSFGRSSVLPRIAEASRQAALFDGLTNEQRTHLLGVCKLSQFTPGAILFQSGECESFMHLVLSGQVTLTLDGQEVGCVNAGQCLGEASLLCSPQAPAVHSLNATATTAVETGQFPAQALRALIRRRPDIGVILLRNLAVDVSVKLKRASQMTD